MKISDKIKAAYDENRTVFSFEYFPPRTPEGVDNLFERLDRMAALNPLFCDITWGAGGSTSELTLDIATRMQNMICVETSMHLTCTNMPVEKIDAALETIKKAGLQNVLALRGDPPHGQEKFAAIEGGFSCALDLVRHIKKKYDDYFCITVAGYPEAHPDKISGSGASENAYREDLAYLKEKVDAGASMVITQLFYDVDTFLKFVKDCREMGITVPIIPGIMPIGNYGGFKRMTGFCKTKVPDEILKALEPIKDNDEAVRSYGIQQATDMVKKILAAGIKTIHLYTLNLEKSAIGILLNLGLIDSSKVTRTLPWRPPTNIKRATEDVRPIHWANRPRSYITRTADWDKFPRGRWGDARSPSYGTLSDYQFLRKRSHNLKLKEDWGVPLQSAEDIQQVFVRYCAGEVKSSPWSELEGLQPETSMINEKLLQLNKQGFLTINSQPAVNGAKSDDPSVGWGGPRGYVYQKAYIEFFTSAQKLAALVEKAKAYPALTYIAVNKSGDLTSNTGPADVNAVTWGVFPAKEVVQPSVVDPTSFLVWKDEAFDAFMDEWASLYPEEDASRKVLQEVHDSYYLVSVVDNDYIHGDLFAVFSDL